MTNYCLVYADWCGPCKTISPLYEQLSAQYSRPQKITFVKVDTQRLQEISQQYGVTALPTFIIFKNTKELASCRGADPRKLSEMVKKVAAEVSSEGFPGISDRNNGSRWLGSDLPRGYTDVTDEVDIQGLDLLNANSEFAGARALFDGGKPSGLVNKGKSNAELKKDWVESDTDEQVMLFIPFRATLKVHTLQITSLPQGVSNDQEELAMRPKNIQIYSNRPHVLGFEEAEDIPATQKISLGPEDWDQKTGTAKVELRFVKFQNVTSLVLFVVEGDGDADKVRIDRIRIIGETGEKRDLGKLEKVGENGDWSVATRNQKTFNYFEVFADGYDQSYVQVENHDDFRSKRTNSPISVNWSSISLRKSHVTFTFRWEDRESAILALNVLLYSWENHIQLCSTPFWGFQLTVETLCEWSERANRCSVIRLTLGTHHQKEGVQATSPHKEGKNQPKLVGSNIYEMPYVKRYG